MENDKKKLSIEEIKKLDKIIYKQNQDNEKISIEEIKILDSVIYK